MTASRKWFAYLSPRTATSLCLCNLAELAPIGQLRLQDRHAAARYGRVGLLRPRSGRTQEEIVSRNCFHVV